jgi:hypothetical protein
MTKIPTTGFPLTTCDRILSFLEKLANRPELSGDYQEQDDVGRSVQIKIIADYALTYFADHAVKEVKVTKIEKADKT